MQCLVQLKILFSNYIYLRHLIDMQYISCINYIFKYMYIYLSKCVHENSREIFHDMTPKKFQELMIENNLGNLRSCYRVSFSLCTVRHPQTCLIFLLNFWNCRSSHNCNLNVMQAEQQPVCARCRSVQFISFRFSLRPRKSTGWHWYKRRRWWRMRRLSTSTFAGNGKSWERTQQDTSAWRGTATLGLRPCPLPFSFLLLFPFWNIFYLCMAYGIYWK